MAQIGRVLVVAGSDSGGGAGIQADIKSIMAQGAYAATAITALTAQNTQGVQNVAEVAPAFVAAQIGSVLGDIGADIVKTGMLANAQIVEVVAEHIHALPAIIDPVMVATSGDILLQKQAIDALDILLVRKAFIATPNMPEAALLIGREVETIDDMKRAADMLMERGAYCALIKGGHGVGAGAQVQDLLAMQSGQHIISHPRIKTDNTHGTGCSLASALAANLANTIAGVEIESERVSERRAAPAKKYPPDESILEATHKALDYIHEAIKTAPQSLGKGTNKPINHNVG